MAPGRTPFSKEDDDLIIEWIATWNPQESGRKGNELYKSLANSRNSAAGRHTWQSWRDRYVKNEHEFNTKIKRYLKKNTQRVVEQAPKPKQERQSSVQSKPTSSRPAEEKPPPLPPSDDYSGSIFPRDQRYEGNSPKPLDRVDEDDESQVDRMLTDPMVPDNNVMSTPEVEHASVPLKKRASDQDSGFYESDSSNSPARPILTRRAPPKHVERPFGGLTLETAKAWPPSRKKRSRSSGSERNTPPLLSPKKRKLHDNRSDTPPPHSESGSDSIYTPPKKKSDVVSPRYQQKPDESGDEEDSDHDPLFTQAGYQSKDDAPGSSSQSDKEEHPDHDPLFTQPGYEQEDDTSDADESGEKSPLFTQQPGQDIYTDEDDSEPQPQSSPLFTPRSQAKKRSRSKLSSPSSPLMRYPDLQTRLSQRNSFIISSQVKHTHRTEAPRSQPNSQRESLAQIDIPETPLFTQTESQLSPLFTQVESQRTQLFTPIGSHRSSPSQHRAQRQRYSASPISSERDVEKTPPLAYAPPRLIQEPSPIPVCSPRANAPLKTAIGSSGNAAHESAKHTVSTQSRRKDQVLTLKSPSSTRLSAPSVQLKTQISPLSSQESQQSPLFTQFDHQSKPFLASPDVFNPRPPKQDDIFVQGSSKDSIIHRKSHTTAETPRIDFRAKYMRSRSRSRQSSITATHDSQIISLKEKPTRKSSLPIWLDNRHTGRESSILPRASLSLSASTKHRPQSVDRFSVTPLVPPSHPLLSHTARSEVDPDEERRVIHALGVQTLLESYARDYDVSLTNLYAVYEAAGNVQAAKKFAQERQMDNMKHLERFILSASNGKAAPTASQHSPSPRESGRLTANIPSSSRQYFRIWNSTPVEEADLEEEYSPPSRTRASRLKRLSQQGRAEEALGRERRRASTMSSGGRVSHREEAHTPVSKPNKEPVWGEAEDEILRNGEEDMVAALQVKFGKDKVQRQSARFFAEILRAKGVEP